MEGDAGPLGRYPGASPEFKVTRPPLERLSGEWVCKAVCVRLGNLTVRGKGKWSKRDTVV